MSMLTPRGFEIRGVRHRPARIRARRRRRLRTLLLLLLVLALAGGGWWSYERWVADPSSDEIAATAPISATSAAPQPSAPACPAVATRQVRVNVLNSTARAGLAGKVAKAMRGRGFTVGSVGNAGTAAPLRGPGEVRAGKGGAARAQLVASYLAGARVVTDERTDGSVDLVLGAGYGRLRTAAQARTQSTPPGC